MPSSLRPAFFPWIFPWMQSSRGLVSGGVLSALQQRVALSCRGAANAPAVARTQVQSAWRPINSFQETTSQ
jgi:hypothetical protein